MNKFVSAPEVTLLWAEDMAEMSDAQLVSTYEWQKDRHDETQGTGDAIGESRQLMRSKHLGEHGDVFQELMKQDYRLQLQLTIHRVAHRNMMVLKREMTRRKLEKRS